MTRMVSCEVQGNYVGISFDLPLKYYYDYKIQAMLKMNETTMNIRKVAINERSDYNLK